METCSIVPVFIPYDSLFLHPLPCSLLFGVRERMAVSPKCCSPELRVFKLNFSKLVNCIPPLLATEFYSNDLISRELLKYVIDTTGLPESQKVTKVLLAVEDQIVLNPSILHKFLSVVRADPSLVYIADALSDQYRKYSIARKFCKGSTIQQQVLLCSKN